LIKVKLNGGSDDRKLEWFMDNGKPKQGWGLKLKEWLWFSHFESGVISYLGAKDQSGKLRFEWGNRPQRDNQ